MANLNQRLFVGNLPSKILESDVRKKLSRFGDVQSVEMKQRSDSEGNVLSSFAFVDIAANEIDLKKCFQYFEKELWHRQRVKVQLAKESFLDRLKRERKSSTNVTESPMKTPKNFPVGVLGTSKTVKSLSPHNRTGRDETPCASKDSTLKKKSSRIRGEDVLSPVQVCSSKSGTAFSTDGSVLDKTSSDCPGTNSRGLPMFGGSKIIVGVNDASDNFGGIESQKTKRWSAKSFKSSTPNDVNNLCRRSSKVVNTFEDVEDSCALEPEDVPKRNNLPMFCGSKALLDLDNSVRENSLCNSAHLEVNKQEVSFSMDSLGTSGNQLLIREGTIRSRFNSQNQCPADKDSRNGLRAEGSVENNDLISGSLSKSDSKHKKSPLGKKSITNDVMAEKKRLNALEERKKAFALQKEAVKKALSNIDAKNCANKKIIFNDENDEYDEVPVEDKVCSTQSDKLKPKLFLDESDDEDIKNLESTEFKIKPQFEGHQGQKLLEIQSRYGHDSRFILDERFLESDEEGSGTEQPPSVEEDLNAEKDHQLNILKEMIGVDISERRPKRDKKEKKDSLQMVRFDPTNPEHSKYLVKEEDLKETVEKEGGERKVKKREVEGGGENASKKAKRDEEVQDEHMPVVIERFYKVSDKLKESLRKRTTDSCGDGGGLKQDGSSGGFSLLQKFGSPPSDNEEEEVEYSTKAITRSRNEWEKNPFCYDSSDDDEPEAAEESKEELEKVDDVKAEEPSQSMKGAAETFYFQENDPRLQEGLDFFGIKKTFSEMQEGFHERRADLKLIIKAKVRNNKRKNRPLKKKLGGARKYKKKMAAYRSKR